MYRRDVSIAIAVWALFAGRAPASAQPVRTESGLIEGVQSGASTVYKSIPFAAPPVGALHGGAATRADLEWRQTS